VIIKKETCISRDVAIPADRNVIKKEAEKISKYKDLIIQIQCRWNVKATVIPVIIGATGTISNHSDSTRATYWEITKLRKYNKQGTAHCGKC
jgi:predicted transcriptional regulator